MMFEQFVRIRELKEKFVDKESQDIFDARIDYMLDADRDSFYEKVNPYLRRVFSDEIENKLKEISVRGIIIYGCGYQGLYDKSVIEKCGHSVDFFCDKNRAGQIVDDVPVLDPLKVVNEYKDYLVIIGSGAYAYEMRDFLLENEFEKSNILFPREITLLGNCIGQYFDAFEPNEGEVFVDAGSYDGRTSIEFAKWCNSSYESIIAFEPIAEQCEVIENNFKNAGIKKAEIINKALWNKEEKLEFSHNGTASRITRKNGWKINCIDIDSVIDKRVTFIKMDVEGSEYNALIGAKDTIRKCKPRLAISVYHKPKDIVEIPLLLTDMVPEYKLKLRHYSTNVYETVLYAWV